MASLPLFNSCSHNVARNNTNSQTVYHNVPRKHPCEANGIFWKAEGSKNSQPNTDAYIPGVNNPFNSKRFKKLKWQPYKVQPKSSTISSEHVVKDISHSSNESSQNEKFTGSQSGSQRSVSLDSLEEARKVFLKDLCHEDKLRIANLIQELAKAGEQREDAVSQLSQEREDYKKRVTELTDQVQLLSDEHKQTLCKMTDCHHLLNLYQHILIEQQQQKRRHSMPMTTDTSKHNKENTSHRAKRQNHSLPPALPPRSLARAQPLGNGTHLGGNLQARNSSPSSFYQNSLHPPERSRQRRSLSPRSPRPDSLVSASCNSHQRTHRQRRSLSPSSFPPDGSNPTQHPKLNSSYLLPRANEAVRRISPQTSPCFSDRRLGDGSPMSQLRPLIPETIRPNLKPATSIFKTSPATPIPYDKIHPCNRSNSDVDDISQFPRRYQRSPTAMSVCSNNSVSQHNNSVFANSEHTPEPNSQRPWGNDKVLSPSVSLTPKNATFTNKSKTRLSLGPLQDPIMSSTRRSSDLRSNGSFVSQNTANNQSCGFQSPNGSIQSLPACFQSQKNESTNVCAPLKFETAQSDADYSYVRKLSFSSSVQSLPTDFTRHGKSQHRVPPAAVHNAGKVSFANFDKDFSTSASPARSLHDGKGTKVPGTPDTDCFRSMSNQERRQFLLQQRALLEEERYRLLSLLERPDLDPSIGNSSSMAHPREGCEGATVNSQIKSKTNIVQGLNGASLITNDLPINCLDKHPKSEPILGTNNADPQLLQPLMSASPLTPPQTYNCREIDEDFPTIADECCSVQSNCSFTSKQSSMSLIDLIDSIELKPKEDDNRRTEPYTTSQNSLRIKDFNEQNQNATFSPKDEFNFENQVLQDIFFLN